MKMSEENRITEGMLKVSSNLNDLAHHGMQLDAVLAAVEELMTDLDEAIHKNFHKERTAELLVESISKKVRLIDMAFRPLTNNMIEKIEASNALAEDIVKVLVDSKH